MRLLVLGGTSWLGGAVAAEAVGRGFDVTCLARGESGTVPAGATLVQADRWQLGAYAGLPSFDAAVEVTWQPELARSAVAEVNAEHWVYVSSVSVYDDRADGTLAAPWEGAGVAPPEAYPGAKVACEAAFSGVLDPSALLVARAGLIGGYGDRSDRFGYWPARIDAAREGRERVLVPPLDGPVQVIDVLDLAVWLVHCAIGRVSGTFDAVGPQAILHDVVDASARVAGSRPSYVTASSEQLEAADVRPWMGPESLPLWAPGIAGLMTQKSAAAEAAGLTLRPLAATVADALRWERELGIDRVRTSGLSAEREAAVLAEI